jgi:hypothetical protein
MVMEATVASDERSRAMGRPTSADEWDACDDSEKMIHVVEQAGSDRKLRLFTLQTCLRVAHFVGTSELLTAIAMGEQVADGQLPSSHLESARMMVPDSDSPHYSEYQVHALGATWLALRPSQRREYEETPNGKTISTWTVDGVVFNASLAVQYELLARGENEADGHKAVLAERQAQALLLRDIFGNPFRSVMVDPACLTAAVVSLARAVYHDRAFDCLPILADTLEEAGCTNADILKHCRGPGPHVRGCWVVDMILERS